jgi:predicted Fe-Mo cluster-binding NifX family protein
MKLAISAQGNTLESELDPRFGRCKYFIFVDSETMEYECLENPNINASGGAGGQSAQLVVSKSPDLIITGNLGPKAESALAQSGIKYLTGASGSIKDIVEEYSKK